VRPSNFHDFADTSELSGWQVDRSIEFVIRAGRPDTAKALREYAARRLSFFMRRFEPHVRCITVRVHDLNGPRRGVDSRCSMTADLIDGRRIFVNATTAWPFASVTQAARRLNEAVRRELRRATSHREPAGGPHESTTGH